MKKIIVFQGGGLSIESCSVTSRTGSGVSSDGGTLQIIDSKISDCAAHGIGLYADLEGQGCKARIERCNISSNALNGILVREDSQLILQSSRIARNGGSGLVFKVHCCHLSSDAEDHYGLRFQ